MGELNKAKKTIEAQKATATPTTTTTVTPTTPGHADRQTTTTGTVPTLSEYANMQNSGNVERKLNSSGLAISDLMKRYNTDAYVNTEKASQGSNRGVQGLDLSINNVVDLLQKNNVDPRNATASIRAIFNDPVQRKLILGEKSIFNEPEYLKNFANAKVGGSTSYEDDAVAKIAQYYSTVKPQYDTQYGVTPGRKITETTTTNMPNGEESVNKVIDVIKGTGDKIKVKKTP